MKKDHSYHFGGWFVREAVECEVLAVRLFRVESASLRFQKAIVRVDLGVRLP